MQVEEWLKEQYECFDTAARRSITAEKATMQRVPLPVFSKNGAATKDYRDVVAELIKDVTGER